MQCVHVQAFRLKSWGSQGLACGKSQDAARPAIRECFNIYRHVTSPSGACAAVMHAFSQPRPALDAPHGRACGASYVRSARRVRGLATQRREQYLWDPLLLPDTLLTS